MTDGQRTALITGGATGIGFATARRLARDGANVVILGPNVDEGTAAQAALEAEGLSALFVQGDVTDAAQVEAGFAAAEERFGAVDILVNNAAIANPQRFLDTDLRGWHRVFDVIVDGAYLCSHRAARAMVARGTPGWIVNISSLNAHRGMPESTQYNAAKGALDQLTRCLAIELAEHRIRVNGIAPGFIDTPLSRSGGENELETDWFKDIYIGRAKIPQQRAGQPEEIAAVVAFLVSADASYIMGATIPVDGGLAVTF